jgi:hypothetical protein
LDDLIESKNIEPFLYLIPEFMKLWLIVCLALLRQSMAHSWIACSDYRPADRGLFAATNRNFDPSICKSYARGFAYYNQWGVTGFGEDKGYNRQASGSDPACHFGIDSTLAYSSQYPMASYTAGQRVRLVWPSKNHDSDVCTNAHIPDVSLKVYMMCGADRERYASSGYNPSVSDFTQSKYLLADFKQLAVPDYAAGTPSAWSQGFQNCPFFCDNMDKAVCFQEFVLPSNMSPGTCTFLWYWQYVSSLRFF